MYTIALAWAPFGVSQNSQFLRPTVNGRIAFSLRLLEKLPDDRMSDDELEFLAPWDETVKAEIERRANESNQSYVNCQGAPATEK